MKDLGLFIIRLGLGLSMMVHGYPKMFNPEKWEWLGSQMVNVGIDFAPSFFGFMAAFSEFFGGLFLVLGVFFVPTNLLLFITMFVAMMFHLNQGDDYTKVSHSLELMFVFLALCFTGAGSFSLRRRK